MKNAAVNLGKISGKFNITAIKNGKVEAEYASHNMVLDRLITSQLSSNGGRPYQQIALGDGSTPPSGNESSLTHQLWSQPASSVDSFLEDDLLRGGCTLEAVFPATAAYVGSVREVGVTVYGLGLGTHALIVDAEGNPITIEKDDLLELRVRYTLYWTAPGNSNNLTIRALQWFAASSGQWSPSIGQHLAVLTTRGIFTRNIDGHKVFFGNNGWGANEYGTRQWQSTSRTLTFSRVRIPAEAFNDAYIEHLALGDDILVEAEFPNAALFPVQTLEGMFVGQGDGQATFFAPPLDFWLADTETIYIDGTPLVRGVDYTCDSFNNLSGKYQLLPTSSALLVGGHVYGSDEASKFAKLKLLGRNPDALYSTRLCPWGSNNPVKWVRPTTHVVGLSKTEPLIIELLLNEDPARDFSMDCLILEEDGYYNWTARLSCSNDGEVWEILGEQPMSNRDSHPYGRNTFNFSARVARYWKIEYVSGNMNIHPTYGLNQLLCIYGRRTGRQITFTTPPASGAVITMDAQIDRPLKNNKHVLDFNPILHV